MKKLTFALTRWEAIGSSADSVLSVTLLPNGVCRSGLASTGGTQGVSNVMRTASGPPSLPK